MFCAVSHIRTSNWKYKTHNFLRFCHIQQPLWVSDPKHTKRALALRNAATNPRESTLINLEKNGWKIIAKGCNKVFEYIRDKAIFPNDFKEDELTEKAISQNARLKNKRNYSSTFLRIILKKVERCFFCFFYQTSWVQTGGRIYCEGVG